MSKGPAVGIDLGTTYSCVGIFQHGKVEIIANDQGNRTTPSYVAFTDTERLIGDAAKNQVAMNPSNTVFGKNYLVTVWRGNMCICKILGFVLFLYLLNLYQMPSVSLVVSLMTLWCSPTWSTGPSRLWMTHPNLKWRLNTRVRSKPSMLRRFLQWSSPRWRKLLKPILAR